MESAHSCSSIHCSADRNSCPSRIAIGDDPEVQREGLDRRRADGHGRPGLAVALAVQAAPLVLGHLRGVVEQGGVPARARPS